MKKRTVLHGVYIIRVEREENSCAGKIDIQHMKTKHSIIVDVDNFGVFRQHDKENPGRKVVEKALNLYYIMGEVA